MQLFQPVKPMFEKVAATPLDEDPSKWSSEILKELFRAVPETSEYNPQIVMLRQDDEQGFALGVIVISGQVDSALSQSGSDQPQSRRAMIPIIIKNDELCPLDLVMTQDKKIFPLTGARLREALFRPNTFDMMTDDSGDQSLYSMFYPPGRSSNSPGSGFSSGSGDSGGTIYGPGMKQASKVAMKDTVLMRIAPTLGQHDLDQLSEKISELGLKDRMLANPSFMTILSKLAEFDGKLMTMGDADVLVGKAASYAPIEVAQFGYDKQKQAYWIKQAARTLYDHPERDYFTRGEFMKLAGQKITDKVDTEGTTTVAEPSKDAAPLDTSADEVATTITEPGIYKVRDINGNELVGWALPSLMDFDGTKLPMTAFTNGAVASIQDTIVGTKVDADIELPSAPPGGSGLFYLVGPDGIEATVPCKVIGSEASPDGGNCVHVETLLGDSHVIRFVDGMQGMVSAKGEIALPSSAKFMPLNQEAPIPLMNDEDTMAKSAMMRPYIEVRHGGNIVDLRFHDLPGFAATTQKEASFDDAIFTLCAAGLEPVRAHEIIKQAEFSMQTEYVIGVKDVRPMATFMADVQKTASTKVAEIMKLRRDCVKEAAFLPDIQTVDSVLSLNYINPENIKMFVGKLPYLERALNVIGELVLFARLGPSEIPEAAAARAARALDEVIQGLKGMAMRTPESDTAAAS